MKQTIIGIRFSMIIPKFQKNREIENQESRSTWLQQRIEIFNRITSNSLKNHDVSVLIFMAKNDTWVYDQLDCDERFIPIFSDEGNINILYMAEVEKITRPQDKVILMRMDSDDAIHKDYFVGIDDVSLNTYVVNPVGVMWDGTQGAVVEMKNLSSYIITQTSPYYFR